jgi:hypothetical protein
MHFFINDSNVPYPALYNRYPDGGLVPKAASSAGMNNCEGPLGKLIESNSFQLWD